LPRGGLQQIGHIPFCKDDYWLKCCAHLGYECITKKQVYDTLGYMPLPTIEAMHKSRANHRILAGGNRSGKTYGGMMEIVPYLFWVGTSGWVISGNYDLAEELRRKVEDILVTRAGMERVERSAGLQPWQFSYSVKSHIFTMGTGSTFQLKSAESPDSMHAVPLDWVLIDEAALLPYILYDTRITPRLVDSGGWVLSMGTFEWASGEWFEEYFDLGQISNDMGIESWHHPTENNFHVHHAKGGETPEEIGEKYHANWHKVVEQNPEATWPLSPGVQLIIYNVDIAWLHQQKSRISPEIYAARFEAQRATNPYLVFPTWNIVKHVSAERAEYDPELPVYISIDPGGTYAVAAVQFKKFDDVGQDNMLTRGYSLCVIDELYFQTTVTTHEVYNAAKQRKWWGNVARWPWPHWDTAQGAIDVMTKEQARTWEHLARLDEDIKRLHLMSMKVNRQPGIQTLQHFIDTDSIYVHPRCTFWNLEMRRWTYPQPPAAGIGSEDPRKREPLDAWNHLTKAVIYLLVNKFGYYGRSQGSMKVSVGDIRTKRAEERSGLLKTVVSRFK
jgi:hypothetical protein